MTRSTKILLTTGFVFLLVSFGFNVVLLGLQSSAAYAGKIPLPRSTELDLLGQVFRSIQESFVEGEKAKDRTAILYGGAAGMLKALDDPYSRFMPPEASSEMKTESQGEFGGLGIVIGMRDQRVTVIAPMEGTPAYKMGVLAGDIIVRVDGDPIENLDLEAVVGLLRGKVATTVAVTLFRPQLRKLIELKIVRETIPLPSTRGVLIGGKIGYCFASGFTQRTAAEIEEFLAKWEPLGMEGFVLDLRGNPGGLLDAAVATGRLFLGKGTIVSVKGRTGSAMTYKSFRERFKPWPMVVLIDEGSASASEIVAGAIHDSGRGILVGAKSFGKGSVQTVMTFKDGASLVLTTAYYYTPAGTLIHKKGIQPDIAVEFQPLTTDGLIDLRKWRSRFFGEPSLEKEETLSPDQVFAKLSELDPQLSAAVELLRGSHLLSGLAATGG